MKKIITIDTSCSYCNFSIMFPTEGRYGSIDSLEDYLLNLEYARGNISPDDIEVNVDEKEFNRLIEDAVSSVYEKYNEYIQDYGMIFLPPEFPFGGNSNYLVPVELSDNLWDLYGEWHADTKLSKDAYRLHELSKSAKKSDDDLCNFVDHYLYEILKINFGGSFKISKEILDRLKEYDDCEYDIFSIFRVYPDEDTKRLFQDDDRWNNLYWDAYNKLGHIWKDVEYEISTMFVCPETDADQMLAWMYKEGITLQNLKEMLYESDESY